jgi:hypothetical protein
MNVEAHQEVRVLPFARLFGILESTSARGTAIDDVRRLLPEAAQVGRLLCRLTPCAEAARLDLSFDQNWRAGESLLETLESCFLGLKKLSHRLEFMKTQIRDYQKRYAVQFSIVHKNSQRPQWLVETIYELIDVFVAV